MKSAMSKKHKLPKTRVAGMLFPPFRFSNLVSLALVVLLCFSAFSSYMNNRLVTSKKPISLQNPNSLGGVDETENTKTLEKKLLPDVKYDSQFSGKAVHKKESIEQIGKKDLAETIPKRKEYSLPENSIYSLKAETLQGDVFDLSELVGSVSLIVNLASK